MFIVNCFIRKNTPELRKYLISIGYKNTQNNLNENSLNKCRMLFANYPSNGYFSCTNLENYSNDDIKNTIDCGTNEELFAALIPINDKSDINQWFITYDDNIWFKSEFYHIENYARKANIKEILQHFNK